jgi:hypothetical protein
MTMERLQEIVHIIPLGQEIDREVRPYDLYKVNRVYILVIREQEKYSKERIAKQEYYTSQVLKRLKALKIPATVIDTDMFDLLDVICKVSGIIHNELEKNNLVYVNMSSAGRLTSIGVSIAAMAKKVQVYYVNADRYSETQDEMKQHGISICEKSKVLLLQNFEIALPDEWSMMILTWLYSANLRAAGVIGKLAENKVEGFLTDISTLKREDQRKERANQLMKLDKRYLAKLEERGYITRRKIGREVEISLTESGKYVACVSGMVE